MRKEEQPMTTANDYFCRLRTYDTTAFTWSAVRLFTVGGCFAFSVTALPKSPSDSFLASSEIRLGAFIAGLPAASGPWHIAHFALNRAAPSSAAQDRLGIRMNRATAITMTSITTFVVFMISFFLLVKSCNVESCNLRKI